VGLIKKYLDFINPDKIECNVMPGEYLCTFPTKRDAFRFFCFVATVIFILSCFIIPTVYLAKNVCIK